MAAVILSITPVSGAARRCTAAHLVHVDRDVETVARPADLRVRSGAPPGSVF
jgi:hypothetical protein